ncbi:MAG: ABC transporter substrate-binding protein [Dehalococcoidia bacterium]|nr:ABC transporter substrate-binding protein [Dehalococcoidia bacterium]
MTPVLLLDRPAPLVDGIVEASPLDTTRREFLTGAGTAALAAAFLAACGDDDPEATPTATDAPTTRTVDSARGPVEIPIAAQSIIPVDPTTSLALVDVGIEPRGALSDWFTAEYWPANYVDALSTRSSIGSGGVPDVELIATLAPDLVIGAEWWSDPAVYDQLSGIAPTVVIGEGVTDWKAIARKVADTVGRSEVLAELEREVDALAEDIKSRHAEVLGRTRWAVISAYQDQWYLSLEDAYLPTLLVQAGVQLGSAAAGLPGGVQAYSYEQLQSLDDVDVILFPADNVTGEAMPGLEPLFEHPLWLSLPAVQEGRLFGSPDLDLQSFGWALQALQRLDGLLTELE